ncbi:hypothetical protein EGR_08184 [Echinococcus granulosus]|uniref:Uncharacterized protein n=1 Tax=Echinococcus granulosus TaxID=6210 RepID=W6UFT4_ECHGR|nr:hypothetical protein EGR_08184 [Echinococcus granulosus]EUB56947.1 hypothetical protein EGR_08184 [Echinococcus granulosus]
MLLCTLVSIRFYRMYQIKHQHPGRAYLGAPFSVNEVSYVSYNFRNGDFSERKPRCKGDTGRRSDCAIFNWTHEVNQCVNITLEVNTFHTAILHSHVPAHLPMTWLDKRLCQLLFQQPSPASFLNALAAIQYQKAQIDSCQSLLSTLAQNRQHISMHFRLL